MPLDNREAFKPDYSVARLTGIGIAGFVIGCFILFWGDIFSQGKAIFHEVRYNPRDNAMAIINNAYEKVKKEIASMPVQNEQVGQQGVSNGRIGTVIKPIQNNDIAGAVPPPKEPTGSKKAALETLLKTLEEYRNNFNGLSQTDTLGFYMWNRMLHYTITPDILNKWDDDYNHGAEAFVRQVNCMLKDPKLGLPDMQCVAEFTINNDFKSDIEFFTRYPSTGIWVLLVLVFCSFCFIAVAMSRSLNSKALEIFDNEDGEGPSEENKRDKKIAAKNYLPVLLVTIAGVALFWGLWLITFFDDHFIKDIFFMRHLQRSLNWIVVIGSLAGAFCLAGLIYSSSLLSRFVKPLVKISYEVKQLTNNINQLKLARILTSVKPVGLAGPPVLPSPLPGETELAEKTTEQDKQKIIFDKLAGVFRTYFMLAAIILSLVVFTTGALFDTINSLNFTKMLSDDWGYSPVKSDFIYFFGALCSVLLLLVYIPAKLRFSEVDIWSTKSEPGKLKDILKNPFSKMNGALVAASPLLASLVQSLFDALFN